MQLISELLNVLLDIITKRHSVVYIEFSFVTPEFYYLLALIKALQ